LVKELLIIFFRHTVGFSKSIGFEFLNEAFRKGFLAARAWYFADMYGEDGRNPEEPQHAVELNAEEVLRLVVMLDDQGR
jgi:hypothetical protein